jgi:hypothetical protein
MNAPLALHRTTDVFLASFLLYQKVPLAGCRRIGPKTVEFLFAADARLHALLRLYWSGEPALLVPALLMAALRTLKKRSFIGK